MEESLVKKIKKGQFVDLAKLLPKEKVLHEDGKLQMVNKDSLSYLQPLNDKSPPTIKSQEMGTSF